MRKLLLLFLIVFCSTTYAQITNPASNITVECGDDLVIQDWSDLNGGAVASDACGAVSWTNDFSGANASCSEDILVTFTASNSCGDFQTQATLTIQDTTAPTIINPPFDIVLECGDSDVIPEVLAEDNCGAITIDFFESTSGGGCEGEYIVTRTWTVTDDCGNNTVHVQAVVFTDTTAPNITTLASDESVICDGSGNVAELNNWLSSNGGAVASDSCSDVTWSNDFTSLDSDCSATVSTTVTFTATDSCGNSISTTATFTIEETINECPEATLVLSTQAEIDAFPMNFPNCTSINQLDVSGNDVVDLTPLSSLTVVSNIFIHDTELLQDLNGLQNIVAPDDIFGPYVILQDNLALENITALSSLNTTSPDGYGGIGIRRNPALLSLDGLQGFSTILEFVDIQDNDALIDLNGLQNVVGADDFNLIGNDSLLSLSGIDSFILGGILIENNAAFQSLVGMNPEFNSGILLRQNPSLQNLEGLEVVSSLFGLFLENNNSLSDISAIENIQLGSPSGGTLIITDNPNLSVCNVTSICNFINSCDANPVVCTIQIENNAPGCDSIPEVALDCGIPLPNDECVDAIEFLSFQSITAYNIGATQSPQIPSCNDSANRIDVWFSFVAEATNNYFITVNGGVYNLQLWEGDCSNLIQVPNMCGVNELFPDVLNIGDTYYLQVWSDELDRAPGIFDLTIGLLLSVEKDSFENVSLFPNPINSILNFEAKDIVDQITIFNAIGQEIVSIVPNQPNGLIDLSDFSSGLYFVRLGIGEKNKTFKVLKE